MATPLSFEPKLPSRADAELAKVTSRALAAIVGPAQAERLRVVINDETVEVPISAMKLLAEVLSQMALGRAVQVVPHNAELTTQQAADLLNVSRPFVIKQLEAREIPYHLVGTHRRIYFADVARFRERMHASQRAAADELLAASADEGWNRDP